jgi:hypothetical protein
MTMGDILFGLLIACGFFLSAAVGRFFRSRRSGIIFGGVIGLAFSVTALVYGLNTVFDIPTAEAAN